MGILDDAIKEHLELKRQHGAGESELQQLEDEAFGAAERPGGEAGPPDPFAEAPTQFMAQPEIAEEKPEAGEEPPREEASSRRRGGADIADLQEPPEPDVPAEEPAPAMEHEAIQEPPAEPPKPEPAGPSTEEREVIADQPTEMYDVEEELAGGEAQAPSEEELVEEEISEPRLAPVDPISAVDGVEEDTEAEDEELDGDDFFDEQRLSDELDQALEAPAPPRQEEEEEDVLEETPDFLEEAPEDDQLWFEQKPPKDFDFDD